MIQIRKFERRCLTLLCGLGLVGGFVSRAEAGGLFRKRAQEASPTAYAPSPARPATLGTFYVTPYITVRGNWPAGGGYSPLDQFGDATMAMYGPHSSFRATSAPVLSYSRGYDGRTVILEGTSFSTPLLPSLSPVVYPTQAIYFFAPRASTTPPWWKNGINWVDQN